MTIMGTTTTTVVIVSDMIAVTTTARMAEITDTIAESTAITVEITPLVGMAVSTIAVMSPVHLRTTDENLAESMETGVVSILVVPSHHTRREYSSMTPPPSTC